jgi:hypothetical protein
MGRQWTASFRRGTYPLGQLWQWYCWCGGLEESRPPRYVQRAYDRKTYTNNNLGIGKFTIADDVVVEEADLGVNFFLDEECLGLPRSDCCVKLLQELNPDVAGESFNFGKVYPQNVYAWCRC